ncbi:sigma-54 interaction domain-containing protein [Desulfoluna spongiiphila]|uniref:Arginine utilization regulatory protein n=1 Tax=Desulfoluna spongiiphila TaxID=419481 RepID=A0A1G5AVJ4_9BACT|nr:sigma 54-interacting transcriptional regulator [Desulfoluna spongiiphila]SCX81854.1 arginine utilization regulatory protein [Desulfoluna spongiiphila]
MGQHRKSRSDSLFDVTRINFLSVLDQLDEGIIITDHQGVIVYYNDTQAQIDGTTPEEIIGKHVTEVYELSDETSMIAKCMEKKRAIRNRTFFYRTRKGKVAHTIHSIFPLLEGTRVTGAICFVKDYNILQKSTPMIAVPSFNKNQGNGTRYTFGDIIGDSYDLQRAMVTAREAASSSSPIMLIGETGTGKELFAQSIHNHSARKNKAYTALNCAAIPENLLEGVLFGTVKGAFTGALDKPGLLEMGNGGTLFLDELLAMPTTLQAKLLRVLQEKKFRRIGSHKEVEVELKVISAMNGSPREAVKNGQLRTDLFYRLGVVIVQIPPLRNRLDDLENLISHFILTLNHAFGTHVKGVSPRVLDLFKGYRWPGNVRELEHLIEGAMNSAGQNKIIGLRHFTSAFETLNVLGNDEGAWESTNAGSFHRLTPAALPLSTTSNLSESQKATERQTIAHALTDAFGNVSRASKILGISRQLLHYKMKKHKLNRKAFSDPPAP